MPSFRSAVQFNGIAPLGLVSPVLSKSALYTTLADDAVILANGTFTVTLLTAAGNTGQHHRIINSGTGVITIATTSSQTINGASTYILGSKYAYVEVISDGSNWLVVDSNTGQFPAGFTSAPVAITWASTITPNAAAGNTFRCTLAGATTIAAPTNPIDGQTITFELTQDGTGSRTVSWNSAYFFTGTDITGTPAVSTAVNTTDFFTFRYRASSSKWVCVGYARGYASV